MNRVGLYPGSFDPPHNGHMDIIHRASRMFDRLIVGVGVNHSKKRTLDEYVVHKLLNDLLKHCDNITICTYSGPTIDVAQLNGARTLVRGVRSCGDFESEMAMAAINNQFGLETIFLPTSPEFFHVSSSAVRGLMSAGLPISNYVPELVETKMREVWNQKP